MQVRPYRRNYVDGKEVERCYTTGQVAMVIGISVNQVLNILNHGRLPYYRLPGSRDRRVTRVALVQFLQEYGLWETIPLVSRRLMGLTTEDCHGNAASTE